MDIRKRLIAIINPISGTRHKEDLPTVIREELDSNAFSTEIIMTQYAGHAEELTRKAVDDGIDYVLAVGRRRNMQRSIQRSYQLLDSTGNHSGGFGKRTGPSSGHSSQRAQSPANRKR